MHRRSLPYPVIIAAVLAAVALMLSGAARRAPTRSVPSVALVGLHADCSKTTSCGVGQVCMAYRGFARALQTCEIPCNPANPDSELDCQEGMVCAYGADAPRQACFLHRGHTTPEPPPAFVW